MTGSSQPLSSVDRLVTPEGTPTAYFTRWAQQRQIDIDNSVPKTRKINTGTGLEGGGNLAADLTLALTDTAVNPGSYGDATHTVAVTVDQQGRITAIETVEANAVPEAPKDGRFYCRQNSAWVAVDVHPV